VTNPSKGRDAILAPKGASPRGQETQRAYNCSQFAQREAAIPRFVVLRHDHPALHWDLMLEAGEVLRTWRLSAPLSPEGGAVEAAPSFDHRRMYLDYEGPVSGDRGSVVRQEHGTFTWLCDTAEEIVLRLEGAELRGTLVLTAVGGKPGQAVFTPAPEQ
jgi:hypothetical protein